MIHCLISNESEIGTKLSDLIMYASPEVVESTLELIEASEQRERAESICRDTAVLSNGTKTDTEATRTVHTVHSSTVRPN